MKFVNRFLGPAVPLSIAAQKGNNNYDLLRLMAAIMVIVCHAYAVAKTDGWTDPLYLLLKFSYSGALALVIFFFLSGLFISSGIQRNPNLGVFFTHRILRIFPGLIGAVFLSVYLLGPCFTTLGLKSYFMHRETMTYFYHNIFIFTNGLQWNLPGVFLNSKFPGAVNGSLWTLPLEFRLYLMVGFFGLWSFFRTKAYSVIFFALFAITVLLNKDIYDSIIQGDHHSYLYIGVFIAGGICSFFTKEIIIGLKGFGFLSLLSILLWETPFKEPVFYVWFIYALLFLFQTKIVRSIALPGDYSYGVYIYGWPVQQMINALIPGRTPLVNMALSIPCALLLAIFSWHFIEKPCLQFASSVKASGVFTQEKGESFLKKIPLNLIIILLLIPVPFIFYKLGYFLF